MIKIILNRTSSRSDKFHRLKHDDFEAVVDNIWVQIGIANASGVGVEL
uniref:Uncharacterized protein n=1 Tax=Theileria parva TaxID=5875 RepID=Q4N1Z4_THEPA|eukprot:XP_764218.1 hypothetical protein [Theileria parva strain Muguga]